MLGSHGLLHPGFGGGVIEEGGEVRTMLSKECAQERAVGALNEVAVKVIVEPCADIAIAKVGECVRL